MSANAWLGLDRNVYYVAQQERAYADYQGHHPNPIHLIRSIESDPILAYTPAMDTSGLDVERLKALAIAKWNSAPELRPVKVLPLSRLAEIERKNGGRRLERVGGYFTCLRAIRGKNPHEMEEILGFAPGVYSSGASIWKFTLLPVAAQFELRGYTQLPSGNPFDGIILRCPGAVRPQFLTRDGEAAEFIPGLAVEQWELCPGIMLPAIELAQLAPDQRFVNWA
jgi:hypothetical protein